MGRMLPYLLLLFLPLVHYRIYINWQAVARLLSPVCSRQDGISREQTARYLANAIQ